MLNNKRILWLIIAIGIFLITSIIALKYMQKAETCAVSEEALLGINDLSESLKQLKETSECE
jgi:Tfp pilus assembly major pilin PilA